MRIRPPIRTLAPLAFGLLAFATVATGEEPDARNMAIEHFGDSPARPSTTPSSTPSSQAPTGRGSWSADSLVSVLAGESVPDTTVASRHSSRSADLEVKFEFDSAQISEDNRGDLDAVGEALKSPKLQDARFMVAGHTDDVGDPAYNKDLSLRRAEAAKQYLIQTHEIEAERLEVEGFGSEKPIDESSSKDARARNRRVTIEAIQ